MAQYVQTLFFSIIVAFFPSFVEVHSPLFFPLLGRKKRVK
ncbi:hypothetical protein B4113_1194 [Geobacillus sp. B4113_201601]|nr:hypothetical protein B4113_1194 [Geobacillus sp. B4113_201601]